MKALILSHQIVNPFLSFVQRALELNNLCFFSFQSGVSDSEFSLSSVQLGLQFSSGIVGCSEVGGEIWGLCCGSGLYFAILEKDLFFCDNFKNIKNFNGTYRAER